VQKRSLDKESETMTMEWEMDQHEGSFQDQFSEIFKKFYTDQILTICAHVKELMDLHRSIREMIS